MKQTPNTTVGDLNASARRVVVKLRTVQSKLDNEDLAPGSEDKTDLVAAAEALKDAAHRLYMLARRYEEGL